MMSDENRDDVTEDDVEQLLDEIAGRTGPDTEIDATTILTEREEREAVYRHVFMGQKYDIVADILGVSSSTISNILQAYRGASGTELETAILNQFTDEDDPEPDPDATFLTYSGEDREPEDTDADDDEDDDPEGEGGEDSEPDTLTDGGVDASERREADIPDTDVSRVTEVSEDLTAIMNAVSEGDTFAVEYVDGALDVSKRGTVTEVHREFGDVRFAGGAYFHVNTDTGDYQFHDGGRKRPEDGYEVRAVRLYPERGDA